MTVLAGCSGILGNGDSGGGYSCPPTSKEGAGKIIEGMESNDFSVEGRFWVREEARQIGDRSAPGANATFEGPSGDPFNVGVFVWDSTSSAQQYTVYGYRNQINWEGEQVLLDDSLKARVEHASLEIHSYSENRDAMNTLLEMAPCFSESDVVANS